MHHSSKITILGIGVGARHQKYVGTKLTLYNAVPLQELFPVFKNTNLTNIADNLGQIGDSPHLMPTAGDC